MVPQPVRVMLVDDNELSAEAVARCLRDDPRLAWAGWCGEPGEPLQQVRDARPHVLLLDIGLPRLDCWALLGRLAAELPRLAVVMFTGYLRSDYIDRAFDLGATGFICKGDPPDEIRRTILVAATGVWAVSGSIRRLAAGPAM